MRLRSCIGECLGDLRFAVRHLVRAPGFALVAVLTFALGIGATSAIFGVVHTVVLRPLPFADPDRVVVVGEEWHGQPGSVSVGNFVDWRTHATSFAALAAKEQFSFNLSDEGTPERVIGGRVTHTWFEVAGIGPLHGRVFTREEDAPGRDRVVVLSHRLWTRRFGGDPLVVGRGIALNGVNHSVIGVMRPEFDLTAASEELWTPVAFTPAQTADHDNHYLTAMARLAPGRSIDEARAELKTVYASMRAEYPGDHQVTQGVVEPFHRQFVGEYRQRLFVLLGAVALVLLIACVNVATLLLARGSARGREIALRAAIGAGRGRIARLLFTETLVLTLAGAAAGVAVAWLGVPVLVAYGPEGVPRLEQARVDGVVLGFALLIAILSALVAGLAPVIRAVMTDLRAVLNEGGRTGSPGRDRLGALLVAAEVGLAIVLLVGAGLLVRSALHLQRVDPGFDPRGVVTARLTLPAATYGDHTRVAESFEQIVSTLADMPGVRSAAASTMVPLTPGGNGNGLLPADKPIDPNYTVHAQLGVVTLDHFRTLRTPLRRGRSFTIDDRRGAPRVMIVNESAARGLFPGEDPIGKRVGCCEDPSDDSRMKTIIGVVADVRSLGPAAAPRPEFFLPIAQAPTGAWTWVQRTMTLVARADRGDVAQAMSAIREAVRRLDPTLPLYQVRTMEARLQASAGQSTFNTGLMLLLGAVGLCLSVLGTYGVISSFVTHRQREIGIRMALGAGSTDVMWLVVRQGMRPVLAGVLLGLAAAFASSRVLSAYVHGVTTTDPLTFGAVVAVLTAAALVAVTVPARRALRIDPGRVLSST